MVIGINLLLFLYNWGLAIAIGLIISYMWGDYRSVVAGIIGLIIGVIITFLVSLGIPTENLMWAVLGVGDASFFAGYFGHWRGLMQER